MHSRIRTTLETETRQPRFHFEDPVSLDLNGPTGANPNRILPGIVGNRDLEGRSQFVQEETPVARDFFDPGRHPRTVLSMFRIYGQKSHRVVGFVLGSIDLKRELVAFVVLRIVLDARRNIPAIRQDLGLFRDDGRDRRFRNHTGIQCAPETGLLFQRDPAFCGILLEKSLYLCRRMLRPGVYCVVIVSVIG